MKSLIIPTLLASSVLLLSACGDNTPELNNYNCTTDQLQHFKEQKDTTKEAYADFVANCKFKKLGEYNQEWKKIEREYFHCWSEWNIEDQKKCEAPMYEKLKALSDKWKQEGK